MSKDQLLPREFGIIHNELERPEYRGIKPYINDQMELVLDQCKAAQASIVNVHTNERGVKVGRLVIAWVNPYEIAPGHMVSAELPLEQLERMVIGAAANAVAFSPMMGAARIYAAPTLAVQLRVAGNDVQSALSFEPIRAAVVV